MSQIDLSQFVNKKVKVTTRNGVKHIDYIKQDNGFKFGVNLYYDNGWLKSLNVSNPCGLDIIKIEEVSDMQTEVGQLRDEIAQLKKMVLSLRNDMVELKQSYEVSPKPSNEINLLDYVGKQVEVTFRNGDKHYGSLQKFEHSHYPVLLRGWQTNMTFHSNGRQLSNEEGDYDVIHVEILTPFLYAKLNNQLQMLVEEVNRLKKEIEQYPVEIE